MPVSPRSPGSGRVRQKRRTRRALLDAARRLLGRGEGLAVARVAEEADVSRATAYRYFPSEQALVMELQLDSELPGIQAILAGARGGPAERAAHVQRVFHEHASSNEVTFRHFLRSVHELRLQGRDDDELPRGGRRLEVLEDLLAPLRSRLGKRPLENLRFALAVLIGIEALLVMKDVCGLDTERSGEVGEWAVHTLIQGALAARDGAPGWPARSGAASRPRA